MRRRKFIQQASYGAAITATGCLPYGIARLLAPDDAKNVVAGTQLKPPGALADDHAFTEACIGCGLCGEVCPPRCIQFKKREGGNELNLPYINPEEKACTLCGKCMDACPTEALTPVSREEIDMGIAQIDRTACYPWVDKGICGACATICPLGDKAIGFDFANIYRPVVTKDCVGCGLCVEVCPHPSLPIKIVKRDTGTVARHAI